MKKENNIIFLENAKLGRNSRKNVGIRNFEGRQTQYNQKGMRNFIVYLNEEDGLELEEMGINVKWTKVREDIEDFRPTPYVKVNVKFDSFSPPKIFKIIGDKVDKVTEDNAGDIDFIEFDKVDLSMNISNWESMGRSGKSLYLNTAYLNIKTDYFVEKYGF